MRHGGPEAWELRPVGRTHPSKKAALPGQPSLSRWPSPWCGVRDVPSRPSRSGRGGPPPSRGPAWALVLPWEMLAPTLVAPRPWVCWGGREGALGQEALPCGLRGVRTGAERGPLAMGGEGQGVRERGLQWEVLGRRAGAGGLRHPGSGSPQGGGRAPEHITGVLVWTDLPPSASGLALAGWSTLLQPQARPLRAPGPLVELSPVPGHVSWERPAPPSGLALTCPPGELAGSTRPWLAGQGRPQWPALAFCSSEMARPGWMSGRRRSLPPGVFLRLREGEGAEGPGSPPCLHHVCAQNPSSS